MALSPGEIKRRELQALKTCAESTVLARWYNMLRYALEQEGAAEVSELNLAKHWFGGDYDLVQIIRVYQKAAGIEPSADTDVLVVKFIKEVLGDQLKELGREPERVSVVNGMDATYWVFMLKPGEEPILNG